MRSSWLALVCLLTPTVCAAAPLRAPRVQDHVDEVRLQVLQEYGNNVLSTPTPFALEIYVSGDLQGVTVTLPDGQTVPLMSPGPGTWYLPDSIDSATPPSGTFQFFFDTPAGSDSASLTYDPVPLRTKDFAFVTSPVPGDSYASIDASFEWTLATPGAGSYIKAEVTDEVTGQLIGPVFLAIQETSWDPGIELHPGRLYEFVIDVENAVTTTESTGSGDTFLYDTRYSHSNFVGFRTRSGPLARVLIGDTRCEDPFLDIVCRRYIEKAALEARDDFEQAGYDVLLNELATTLDLRNALADERVEGLCVLAHGSYDLNEEPVPQIWMFDQPIVPFALPKARQLREFTLHACGQDLPEWHALVPSANFIGWKTGVYPWQEYFRQLRIVYEPVKTPSSRVALNLFEEAASLSLHPLLAPARYRASPTPGTLWVDYGPVGRPFSLTTNQVRLLDGPIEFDVLAYDDLTGARSYQFGFVIDGPRIESYRSAPVPAVDVEISCSLLDLKELLEDPFRFHQLVDRGRVLPTVRSSIVGQREAADILGRVVFDQDPQPTLFADTRQISLSSGGTQVLELDATSEHAGREYLVLGSFSGTAPGLTFAGLELPLNDDGYLRSILTGSQGFLTSNAGSLDFLGRATARFTLPPGAPAMLQGIEIHHAFVLLDPPGPSSGPARSLAQVPEAVHVSNHVSARIVP